MKINRAILDFDAKTLSIWVDNVRSNEDFEWLKMVLQAAEVALEIVYPKELINEKAQGES